MSRTSTRPATGTNDYVGLFDPIQGYGVIERCEGHARRYLPARAAKSPWQLHFSPGRLCDLILCAPRCFPITPRVGVTLAFPKALNHGQFTQLAAWNSSESRCDLNLGLWMSLSLLLILRAGVAG